MVDTETSKEPYSHNKLFTMPITSRDFRDGLKIFI
jgi:hypothetical protein